MLITTNTTLLSATKASHIYLSATGVITCHSPPWNTVNGRNHGTGWYDKYAALISWSDFFHRIRESPSPIPQSRWLLLLHHHLTGRRLKKGMIPCRYWERTSSYPTCGKAKKDLEQLLGGGYLSSLPGRYPKKNSVIQWRTGLLSTWKWWKTIVSVWGPPSFQVRTVGFREGAPY